MAMGAIFSRMLAVLVGLLFLFSGYVKISDPQSFFDAVLSFQVVSQKIAYVVVLGLPVFELILGIVLFIPRLQGAALWVVNGLLGAFCLLLLATVWRGIEADCGCFGRSMSWLGKTPLEALGRDVLLLLFTLPSAIMLSRRKKKSHEM